MSTRWLGYGVLGLALTGCYDTAPPPDVATGVELERFAGKWFEIAKLPRLTEANCTATVASYTLRADGDLDMTSECHLDELDGPVKSLSAKAKVIDRAVTAKLALDVGGFYGDYWILEVGQSYEYAVIGHPSRDYLWVLSRTPTLDDSTLHGILKRAEAQRFDVSRLEYTQQR
jgi:apolipoprotein D and lipocalin family protein